MSSHAPSFFTRYFFPLTIKILVYFTNFCNYSRFDWRIFSLLIRMELQDPGMQILGDDYQNIMFASPLMAY